MTQMKYSIFLTFTVLLVSYRVSGFASPSAICKPTSRAATCNGAEVTDVNDTFDCELQEEVGRRQFLSCIVGAASVLALSESASATDEPYSTTSNSLVIASDTPIKKPEIKDTAVEAPIDTRAIFDKAARKALGGELLIS